MESAQKEVKGCEPLLATTQNQFTPKKWKPAQCRLPECRNAVAYPQFLQVQLLPQLQWVQVQFGLLHFCPLAPFARRRLDVVFIKKLFYCF